MADFISNLTGEQALQILRRLADKGGSLAETVRDEAKDILAVVDIDETAEEVFFYLDCIDVHDCWDKSGPSRHGYTSPDDAAAELIEEELQPFLDQPDRYHDLGMAEQERDYCMGIVLGAYKYEHESKSEFKSWCTDIPLEYVSDLLDRWRARKHNPSASVEMNEFIRRRCPEWARYLIRSHDRPSV